MRNLSILFLLLLLTNALFGSDESTYYVYSDKFDNGSPSGIMGASNGKSLYVNPLCTENTYKGDYCLKLAASGEESWCGLYVQKSGNWLGVNKDAVLADLTDKKYLVFHIRSDKKYTLAKIGFGETKETNKEETKLELSPEWQRVVMELPITGMASINGLFMVVFESAGTVFLDEIYYTSKEFVPENSDKLIKERTAPLDTSSFYVYTDKFVNGIPDGLMGENNGSSLKFDFSCSTHPYMGPKCIKLVTDRSESWRGLYIHTTGAWNSMLNEDAKLTDLSAYDQLEFYARAEVKKSEVYLLEEIGVGQGDALEEQRREMVLPIGTEWQRYTIDLRGMNRKKINSLLYLLLPVGTLYLDEIRFIKTKNKKNN